MRIFVFAIAAILLFAYSSFSQERTNDEINRQIRSSGVDHINVSFDPSSNMTKLMAVGENFSNRDADSAGVQAINFALGFFYAGQSLKNSPDSVHFSFWVLTKKPRFAEDHHLTVDLDARTLDLGDARYAAKPERNLEYLNFEFSLADLAAFGPANKAIFHVGNHVFTVTSSQMNTIKTVGKIVGGDSGKTF